MWNPDPLGAVAEGQAQHRVAAYLSPAGFVTAGDHSLLQAVLDEGLRFAEMANRQSHRARALIAFPISTAGYVTLIVGSSSLTLSPTPASASRCSPEAPAIHSVVGRPSPDWWSCSTPHAAMWR
jgi:hypothetical protein